MQFISCFRFVGAKREYDLLKIKISNEAPLVELFLILYNQTRYNGLEYSDSNLDNLKQDPFFAPYLSRIKIHKVQIKEVNLLNTFNSTLARNANDQEYLKKKELTLLSCAKSHVNSAYECLKSYPKIENYFIISSDLDESIDFANTSKKKIILSAIYNSRRSQNPIRILRHKYEYDYDNSWPEMSYRPSSELHTRWIYILPWKQVKATRGNILWDIRGQLLDHIISEKYSLAFEYTSCLTIEELVGKCQYIEHANTLTKYDILFFLKLNKKLSCSYFKSMNILLKYLNSNAINLERFENLDENQSCTYVLNNLGRLKTRSVASNYQDCRKKLNKYLKLVNF